MRIVIDMQGAQTESGFRGIGRYTMAFSQAVVRNRGEHEIILALSGLFPETIEPIRAAFDGLLPQENIKVWYSTGPVRNCDPDNEWRSRVAQLIREAFLASLRPDIVHLTSLFEGYNDDAVTSIGVFDQLTPVSISLHDLTHLLSPDHYLKPDPGYERFYRQKVTCLEQASVLLVTSQSLEKDAKKVLDLNEDRIINVSCNIEAEFCETDWDSAAHRAIGTWINYLSDNHDFSIISRLNEKRPKLAFISPLPPERTGIADYSAKLLPALADYYEINMIVAQNQVDFPEMNRYGTVRDLQWFKDHACEINRIIYHIGNSPYHQHMLALLREIPGTVVLHDFYISHLLNWMEVHAQQNATLVKALYAAHGYPAVRDRFKAGNLETAVMAYPANLEVLQCAQGVVVHSEYARQLAGQWYGEDAAEEWQVIPLVRSPPTREGNRETARASLGLAADDFVICSFGFVGHTKLNHRLLNAWLASTLAQDARCKLIFVGENPSGDYGNELSRIIRRSNSENKICITGFVTTEEFQNYLFATDVAVQLRTHSRGESSAAMLDCLNHGLPTIVNANGSMAELAANTVWLLPDNFTDAELIEALETLWRCPQQRQQLGRHARDYIVRHHTPEYCAKRYAAAIEHFHSRSATKTPALLQTVARLNGHTPHDVECQQIAKAISASLPLMRPARRLLLDVSSTCRNDLKTGIERVARALMLALLEASPDGYRVEPVYLCEIDNGWYYRFARRYTLELLNCPTAILHDDILEPECGDVLLALDLSGDMLIRANQAGLFTYYRNHGVALYSLVFDLLPVLLPQAFPPGANQSHEHWLQVISKFDGAVCISKAVADELAAWRETNLSADDSKRSFDISWFHLGADIANSAPNKGFPKNAGSVLKQVAKRPSFLMVGTIEPRKGHLQTIAAFTQLWNHGVDVNLIIVGQEGWKTGVPENMRRTIPEIVHTLKNHPEKENRLFWLGKVSDEYLEKVYAASAGLIAASEGEGFGLPLIEAAQHKLPIIARDIPVFREVAGEHAFYFSGNQPESLAESIKYWLKLYAKKAHPKSNALPWLTWQESAERISQIVCKTEVG